MAKKKHIAALAPNEQVIKFIVPVSAPSQSGELYETRLVATLRADSPEAVQANVRIVQSVRCRELTFNVTHYRVDEEYTLFYADDIQRLESLEQVMSLVNAGWKSVPAYTRDSFKALTNTRNPVIA